MAKSAYEALLEKKFLSPDISEEIKPDPINAPYEAAVNKVCYPLKNL